MSNFAPAIVTLNPHKMQPNIVMQYSQASGAWDVLAGAAPKVEISMNDLVVYQKQLRMTSRVHGNQAINKQLPSVSIRPEYDQMKTYNILSRAIYSYGDKEAAELWGYSLIEALRLANRQAHFQQLRNMLLFGIEPTNNEGLLNAPHATTVDLPADSEGNTTLTTYRPNELAIFLLNLISSLKIRMYLLGQPLKIVFLAPQRFLQVIEYLGIVSLTSYQIPGAGSATVSGMVQNIAGMAQGDEITWAIDDTLIGKGDNGTDAIIITSPVIKIPEARAVVDTNLFYRLTPNELSANLQFTDVAAPIEVPTPTTDGGMTTIFRMRATPGWNIRAEALTILSAKYA